MALTLRPVQESDYPFLYELLKEKTADQNISHQEMPTYEQHCTFNNARPYQEDYIIGDNWGRVYLTHQNEIGIHIHKDHRRKGLASQTLDLFIQRGIPLYANISPHNAPSIKLFTSKGFSLLQHTYKLGG